MERGGKGVKRRDAQWNRVPVGAAKAERQSGGRNVPVDLLDQVDN